jgi:hypothetical protein
MTGFHFSLDVMVKVSFIFIAIFMLAACRGVSLDPEIADGSAVIPRDGAEYHYTYKRSGATDSTAQSVRITCIGNGKFIAALSSPSVAVVLDTFYVREDGDLESRSFDAIYPIGTRGSYAIAATIPLRTATLSNDVIESTLRYDGADRITVADTSFLCGRIIRDLRISSPERTISAHMTYWYSAKAGYFVMERSRSTTNDELNYDRKLISIK